MGPGAAAPRPPPGPGAPANPAPKKWPNTEGNQIDIKMVKEGAGAIPGGQSAVEIEYTGHLFGVDVEKHGPSGKRMYLILIGVVCGGVLCCDGDLVDVLRIHQTSGSDPAREEDEYQGTGAGCDANQSGLTDSVMDSLPFGIRCARCRSYDSSEFRFVVQSHAPPNSETVREFVFVCLSSSVHVLIK